MKPTPTAPTDAAFAHSGFENENYRCDHQMGLTKREYMATQIMTGLVVPAIAGNHNANSEGEAKDKAQMAVRLADALIKELNK